MLYLLAGLPCPAEVLPLAIDWPRDAPFDDVKARIVVAVFGHGALLTMDRVVVVSGHSPEGKGLLPVGLIL